MLLLIKKSFFKGKTKMEKIDNIILNLNSDFYWGTFWEIKEYFKSWKRDLQIWKK